ncbi:hypothetical protein PAPHI01_0575 [Pancytospora philotis]|nr:hypothetical protein PAPHI01_0575 [Pancytospora philotis]
MVQRMDKQLDRVYKDVLEYVDEEKPARAKASFKRKQLSFLGADVKRPKVPFKIGMRRLEDKKKRRLANIQMKQTLGNISRNLKR